MWAFLSQPAIGQTMHHAPSEMELHKQFYSTWFRPNFRDKFGNRYSSCCGLGDCYPTTFKQVNGKWYFMQKSIGPNGERDIEEGWKEIPEGLLEQNQPDPRESPDGRGHVCESGVNTFCAVLGAGI